MTTRLAFYLGRRSDNASAKIGDWLVCAVTRSQFSHVELLAASAAAPPGTRLDGEPYTGVVATMLSATVHDGEVREALRTLEADRWVVVELPRSSQGPLAYVRSRLGTPYGWLDLLSFLLPFRVSWSGSDFCSEVVSAALGLDKPWHTSPGDLWDWAVQQPGARVVPDDELMIPWSAANG